MVEQIETPHLMFLEVVQQAEWLKEPIQTDKAGYNHEKVKDLQLKTSHPSSRFFQPIRGYAYCAPCQTW